MACRYYKFYSVYKHGTDEPVIIHANAKECMERIGITEPTFRSYVTHTRNGTRQNKYDIYLDDTEEDDADE